MSCYIVYAMKIIHFETLFLCSFQKHYKYFRKCRHIKTFRPSTIYESGDDLHQIESSHPTTVKRGQETVVISRFGVPGIKKFVLKVHTFMGFSALGTLEKPDLPTQAMTPKSLG